LVKTHNFPIFHILVFIGSILFLISGIRAQGPPVYVQTPILLGLDGGGVRTFGKLIKKGNVNIYLQPVVVPYNITAKFQMGGIAPFISKSVNEMEAQTGLGDMALFAKYVFFQKDGKGKTFRVLARVKQSFPTGKTNVTPAIGTGSYQTLTGLVAGYVTTKFGVYGDFGYNYTSAGLPDNLVYDFGFSVPLLPQQYPPNQINLSLEFTGNYIFGKSSNNFFVAPAIQYIAGRRVLFETGVQLPLIEDVEPGQKTKFMVLLGTRILIF